MTTTWTSGGVAQSVTTTRNTGENFSDWLARHKAAVIAQATMYPPDVGTEIKTTWILAAGGRMSLAHTYDGLETWETFVDSHFGKVADAWEEFPPA